MRQFSEVNRLDTAVHKLGGELEVSDCYTDVTTGGAEEAVAVAGALLPEPVGAGFEPDSLQCIAL